MAERQFSFFNSTGGFQDVAATTDSTTLGGLTMGGNIDMDSAGKIVGLNDATANGDALAYGQAGNLSALTITSGGDITVSGGGTITGLPATPVGDTDAASKSYVDTISEGLNPKPSVVAATTAAGTLATDYENGDAIDGVTLATGDRILIKDQATGSENGIYVVAATGAPTRADDMAAASGAAAAYMWVQEGTDNGDQAFVCTNDTGSDVVGTDALVFQQFSGTGQITAGTGMTKDGNTLNVGGGDGLTTDASYVMVDLATNSGLTLTGTTPNKELEALLKDANELAKDASGIYVVGVPSTFKIGGTDTSANVSATNLNELTDGSSVTTLHSHAGVDEAARIENSTVAAEALAKADPIYQGATADKVNKADASTNSEARVLGLAKAAASADAAVEVISVGLFEGALSGATAGDEYWLNAGGGLVVGPPAGNSRTVFIGTAKNATDLWVEIHDHGKKSA